MVKWIPEQAHGIFQQLMTKAGKHAGVIWLKDGPPMVRAGITPVEMQAIQQAVDDGAVPIGWIDLQGHTHTLRLEPPFDPPNFTLHAVEGDLTYEEFVGSPVTKEWIGGLYDELCMHNIDALKKGHDAIKEGKHDA